MGPTYTGRAPTYTRDSIRASRGTLSDWRRRRATYLNDRAAGIRRIEDFWMRQLRYNSFRSIYGYYPAIIRPELRAKYYRALRLDMMPNLYPFKVPLNVVQVLHKEKAMREFYKLTGRPLFVENR